MPSTAQLFNSQFDPSVCNHNTTGGRAAKIDRSAADQLIYFKLFVFYNLEDSGGERGISALNFMHLIRIKQLTS
jgi:hypothetical protein